MCELAVYALKGESREKVMEGVVRLIMHDGLILTEGIFGDSMEIKGRLANVDIVSQSAEIILT
jgi:predicted RNA-binding protein